MKILFTGFTSRGVGSDRNLYDYMCNVDVLHKTLQLAGHEVDRRPVSFVTDPCIEEDYDCALVGVAAVNGLSSRHKLGALWTLGRFGQRAAIFPSDGKNVGVFAASVLTSLRPVKWDGAAGKLTECPDRLDYLLGRQFMDRNNVIDEEHADDYIAVWRDVLNRLPRTNALKCDWSVLVPTFAWGRPVTYARAFGAPCSIWDPTNVAIPMQFTSLSADGRLKAASEGPDRHRAWVLSSLQDNASWLRKMKPTWPVVEIGNKRKARAGEGLPYVSELQLIEEYYTRYAGTLAFGYPLAEGGWWRMRFIHAALAGCVTCCDPTDALGMPPSFGHSRNMLERWSPAKLEEVALSQHQELTAAAWPTARTIETVDTFVKGLACQAS